MMLLDELPDRYVYILHLRFDLLLLNFHLPEVFTIHPSRTYGITLSSNYFSHHVQNCVVYLKGDASASSCLTCRPAS